jgi:hypothetical protein
MQVSDSIKKFIAADLAIGLFITATVWSSLGTEGMAAKFCESIHVDRCDEVEWSEEYETGHPTTDSRAAYEEAEVSKKKDQKPRKRIRLRTGS